MSDNEDKQSDVKNVIELRKAGRHSEAFKALLKIVERTDSAVLQARYAKIAASLDKEVLKDLIPIRIAILASTTDKFFRDILGFWLLGAGFYATFFDASYDTIAQTILAPDSALYGFDPDIVWIFTTSRDVRIPVQFERPKDIVLRGIDEAIRDYSSLWSVLKERSRAYIIQNNADLPLYRPLGNYAGIAHWSYSNILRQYNARLIDALPEGVTVFDLEHVSSCVGKEKWFAPVHWYNSRIAFSLDAAGEVACQAAELIAAIKGRAKKCLVLDLDNTLWGGVIADDGLNGIALGDGPIGEAFVDFQKYILELKERGIILAVCSKNEESKAQEPFLGHPDMVLKLEDISIFKANWNNKAENIKEIAALLSIGTDSIVFVDDNPAERELVRTFLPEVAVPALPDDPSFYRQALDQCHYFETVGVSLEDGKRTEYYRGNIFRECFKKDFCDLAGYLKGLEMEAEIGGFDEFYLPRITQLINKSNQFHLTTTRYSEKEVVSLRDDPDAICRRFSLKDKFGDNGLISVVILKRIGGDDYVIDTWCMSCRVLSRGMEEFIGQELIRTGIEKGIKRLVGVYIPTVKNKLVSGLYARLGFTPIAAGQDGAMRWELKPAETPREYTTYIQTHKG